MFARKAYYRFIVFQVCLCSWLVPAFTQQLQPDSHSETMTRPIEIQEKTVFNANGIYADNRFSGARLNAFLYLGHGQYIAVIEPENEPVNPSTWYAFRLWSPRNRTITVNLEYGAFEHRYYPKVSHDGIHWAPMDSSAFAYPDSIHDQFEITVGPDTLWIAAQEIVTASQVTAWCDSIGQHSDVRRGIAARSMQGREIPYFDIYSGNSAGRNLIILMCRQHPPEVTGYFAFQSFIQTLLDSNSLAVAFRKKYRVLAFPLMNPDGVELGHWRHNAGGVDLNRDWGYYRQPETNNISAFIVETARALENKVILGIDFHSTWHDVYYVNAQDSEALPDFWNYWTEAIDYALPEYEPRVDASDENRDVTKNWFVREFGAEGITFEIGDNTDRLFINEKGKAAAAAMMQLLIYK